MPDDEVRPTRTVRTVVLHYWHLILKEAAKFGVVGAVAFVIDLGLYPIFLHNGPLLGHAKLSSAAATGVATLVSWVGNRYWTYRDKRNEDKGRELVLFVFFNVIGLLITVGCVSFSRDVLHQASAWADTAARIVGIALGTIFRFFTYRKFVFTAELDEEFGPNDEKITPRI